MTFLYNRQKDSTSIRSDSYLVDKYSRYFENIQSLACEISLQWQRTFCLLDELV